MARDIFRTRGYVNKFYNLGAQLQAVGLRLQTLKSTQAMTDAMKGVGKAMASVNKQLKLPAMQKIMMNFMRESEAMDMREEMMNDVMDDVFEDDEVESDALVSQVLDEIGLDLGNKVLIIISPPCHHIASFRFFPFTQMPEVGSGQVGNAAPAEAEASGSGGVDAELQARFESLRKT